MSVAILAQVWLERALAALDVMADMDEFFAPPPPVAPPSPPGEDEFFSDLPPVAALARQVGHVGRPRPAATYGEFGIWMLAPPAHISGSSTEWVDRVNPPSALRQVVGMGLGSWTYKPSAPEVAPIVAGGPDAGRHLPGEASFGTVEYVLLDMWVFDHGVAVPDTFEVHSCVSSLRLRQLCANRTVVGTCKTVADFEDSWEDIKFTSVYEINFNVEDISLEDLPMQLSSVRLGARIKWDKLVRDVPPKSAVDRWRREAAKSALVDRLNAHPVAPGAAEPEREFRALLALPPLKRRQVGQPQGQQVPDDEESELGNLDPVRLLDAVSFSLKLRQVQEYSDALDDADRILNPSFEERPARDRSGDASRSTVLRAKVRVDAVGMSLGRRQFDQDRLDDSVQSIHGYTDSSPVTGAEFQGMLVDIVKYDESVRRVPLPASTLHYGRCDAVNKAMCFVWGVWLLFGPTRENMLYFRSKMRSFTTDFGTEAGCPMLPNVLDAFLAWIGGTLLDSCRLLVRHGEQLFMRALRVMGWNHSLGNCMKSTAKVCSWWPKVLDHLRALCRLFSKCDMARPFGRYFSRPRPRHRFSLAVLRCPNRQMALANDRGGAGGAAAVAAFVPNICSGGGVCELSGEGLAARGCACLQGPLPVAVRCAHSQVRFQPVGAHPQVGHDMSMQKVQRIAAGRHQAY